MIFENGLHLRENLPTGNPCVLDFGNWGTKYNTYKVWCRHVEVEKLRAFFEFHNGIVDSETRHDVDTTFIVRLPVE